jgi:hypothetical protein
MHEIRLLTIHRINQHFMEQTREFILRHGGHWIPLPEGSDGLYMIGFPDGTRYTEDTAYRTETRARYTIVLPDGSVVVWYENAVAGSDKKNATISIPKQD